MATKKAVTNKINTPTDTSEESDKLNTDVINIDDKRPSFDINNMNDIIVNGTNDLICAKCFINGAQKGAVGICKDCKYYMCGTCTLEHHSNPDYKKHKYAFFYCDKQFRANQLQRANSFCLDCGHYLCKKCALDHGGFWQYRHHTLIGGRHVDIPEELNKIDAGLRRSHTFTCGAQSKHMAAGRFRRTRATSREKLAPTSLEKSPSRDNTERRPSQLTVGTKNKKSVVISESVATKPRTLIQSTTGRRPLTDTPVTNSRDVKQAEVGKRPKSVRYEDQELAKPAKLLGEFNLKEPSDKKQCNVVVSLNLPDDKLVVADYGNSKLKLFDKQFNFVSSHCVEKFPVALCQSNVRNHEFYASSGTSIFLFDSSQGLNLVQTLKTGGSTVEGITTWASGIALVFTGEDSKTDKKRHWEVHLLDYNGNVKYEVAVRPPFSVKLVTPIWHITSCRDGEQVIISDTFNNRIVCVDIVRWHVVYVIKGKDSGGSPTSLTTDKDGYIYVTWYGEIHKFSEAGVDLGVSITKIGKHAAISYSPAKACLTVCPDKEMKRNKLLVYKTD